MFTRVRSCVVPRPRNGVRSIKPVIIRRFSNETELRIRSVESLCQTKQDMAKLTQIFNKELTPTDVERVNPWKLDRITIQISHDMVRLSRSKQYKKF